MDVCVTAVVKSKTREWLLSESRKQASKQRGAGGNSQWEIHGRKDESRLYVPWGSHGRASLVLLACLVGWELKIVDDMEDVPGGTQKADAEPNRQGPGHKRNVNGHLHETGTGPLGTDGRPGNWELWAGVTKRRAQSSMANRGDGSRSNGGREPQMKSRERARAGWVWD